MDHRHLWNRLINKSTDKNQLYLKVVCNCATDLVPQDTTGTGSESKSLFFQQINKSSFGCPIKQYHQINLQEIKYQSTQLE